MNKAERDELRDSIQRAQSITVYNVHVNVSNSEVLALLDALDAAEREREEQSKQARLFLWEVRRLSSEWPDSPTAQAIEELCARIKINLKEQERDS